MIWILSSIVTDVNEIRFVETPLEPAPHTVNCFDERSLRLIVAIIRRQDRLLILALLLVEI